MNASGGVPGWCNESRVTCMKNYAWWLCHKYDVNYMIMQGNMTMMMRVIINGMVESCMTIYLGMAITTKKYTSVMIILVMSWNTSTTAQV